MSLRRHGVFTFLNELRGAQTIDFACAVGSWGYSAVWIRRSELKALEIV